MIDQDIIIANNIISALKAKSIKQSKLAENLNMPRQTINKMLNGSRGINASELKDIALILDTTMDSLCKISDTNLETNVFRKFVDKVDTEDAKKTILIADELINMIIFHRKAAKEYEEIEKGIIS
jgi:transcriptional regulator with XRE-family HTH domain